jgi:hypothetical protein
VPHTHDAPTDFTPEREYAAPESRPPPVESDFGRSAPADDWSPPPAEHAYRDEPREPAYRDEPREPAYRDEPREPASSASTSEPAPPGSDERQAG